MRTVHPNNNRGKWKGMRIYVKERCRELHTGMPSTSRFPDAVQARLTAGARQSRHFHSWGRCSKDRLLWGPACRGPVRLMQERGSANLRQHLSIVRRGDDEDEAVDSLMRSSNSYWLQTR